MASRAHVIHDYSFPVAPARQRRAVWLHSDDEVVLPRSRPSSGAAALFVSALVASALTAGLAYAVYVSDVPALSVTEAAPLTRSFEADSSVTRANVTNQLSGPAYAVPSREGPITMPEDGWADVPGGGDAMPPQSSSSSSSARDSTEPSLAPAPIQEQLPSAPVMPDASDMKGPEINTPYPNPTTTPPDGIAPSPTPTPTPQAAPTGFPENPYVDR